MSKDLRWYEVGTFPASQIEILCEMWRDKVRGLKFIWVGDADTQVFVQLRPS